MFSLKNICGIMFGVKRDKKKRLTQKRSCKWRRIAYSVMLPLQPKIDPLCRLCRHYHPTPNTDTPKGICDRYEAKSVVLTVSGKDQRKCFVRPKSKRKFVSTRARMKMKLVYTRDGKYLFGWRESWGSLEQRKKTAFMFMIRWLDQEINERIKTEMTL
jgi:hypothetical protein